MEKESSVSYTHLENVVKPYLDIRKSVLWPEREEGKKIYCERYLAVSYTHLDVYKRQVVEQTGMQVMPAVAGNADTVSAGSGSFKMCIRDRSLSGVGVGYLRGAGLSTRGPGWTDHWCTGCHANGDRKSVV